LSHDAIVPAAHRSRHSGLTGVLNTILSMVLALFWAWFIRIINTPMDVSLQLNDPAAAINKLEERIAQARKM
jgi:hypothetical protein